MLNNKTKFTQKAIKLFRKCRFVYTQEKDINAPPALHLKSLKYHYHFMVAYRFHVSIQYTNNRFYIFTLNKQQTQHQLNLRTNCV